MYPDRETALNELSLAGQLNPGRWTAHCYYAALAAEAIAQCCGMNAEKAFVCGLLHDIGRRRGISRMRHVIDGYEYAMAEGWDEVARICLTHSFPVRDIEADILGADVSEGQYEFIADYLQSVEYDEYDKLIILCDALAEAEGFCILEKRFVDSTRRYGMFPCTLDRWNKTFEYKEYFEEILGQSIYTLLTGIEQCIYR